MSSGSHSPIKIRLNLIRALIQIDNRNHKILKNKWLRCNSPRGSPKQTVFKFVMNNLDKKATSSQIFANASKLTDKIVKDKITRNKVQKEALKDLMKYNSWMTMNRI
jgi:hypothetical protein